MRAPATVDHRRRLGTALIELTRRPEARRSDPAELVAGVDGARLVAAALHHRVPGVVYRSLADAGVSIEGLGELRTAHRMAAMAHRRCLDELEGVGALLDALHLPWLVVKGPVLVELAYGDAGSRLYQDLDLVVAGADLAEVLGRLEEAGGTVIGLNWPIMAHYRLGELQVVLPGGTLGDLHWHLLVTRGARARFDLAMGDLFRRRRGVNLGGVDVPTLDVADGILYLCLHASLSGGHQLVWLKDLDQMIDRQPPDWDELIVRARHAGAALVAAMQLERARVVLGAAVPGWVVRALDDGRGWLAWWHWQEQRSGPARWAGESGTGRTVVEATSSTSAASAVQLVRGLARSSWWAAKGALDPTGRRAEEASPSLFHAVGGEESRRRYLAMVGSGRWD